MNDNENDDAFSQVNKKDLAVQVSSISHPIISNYSVSRIHSPQYQLRGESDHEYHFQIRIVLLFYFFCGACLEVQVWGASLMARILHLVGLTSHLAP